MRDDFLIEVLEAERRECNALIQRQWQVVGQLRGEGADITSAKNVLGSVYLSLSIHVRGRRQLRAMLNIKTA